MYMYVLARALILDKNNIDSMADEAPHVCMYAYVSVCVCVYVCMCWLTLLSLINIYSKRNLRCLMRLIIMALALIQE